MENFNKNTGNIEQASGTDNKLGFILIILILVIIAGIVILWFQTLNKLDQSSPPVSPVSKPLSIIPSPTPTFPPLPISKILATDYHIFQTFNNCGPAALSMALRFYGINVSQTELGNSLRPYQVPGGNNDDKSVTLTELAEKSKEYGLIPYHRPMGTPDLVKQFIANEIPVITRTLTKPNEDIGHYRIIKGYDDTSGIFIQDDSLQNKNLEYSYDEFNQLWKKFNYEYLVLVPNEKLVFVESILGENVNEKTTWQNAVENSLKELAQNPNDLNANFNLSVAYYNIGNYTGSIQAFEDVESELTFRALWYQIEPILAYYEIGNFTRVFQLTDRVLSNYNRAFSELYILRGKIYQSRGETELARQEFEKAVFYNSNLKEAQEILRSLSISGGVYISHPTSGYSPRAHYLLKLNFYTKMNS